MSDTAPPRLDVSRSGHTPEYAPISPTAAISLIVALVFVFVLAVAALIATLAKESLLDVRLFLFPAISVVLAFVARKQIESSEGTRTGLQYATAGWWISVIVGLGYAAYLLGIQFTIRNDAEQNFAAWTDKLLAIKLNEPNDPSLYEACYKTIAPAIRAQVASPRNTTAMNQVFAKELSAFQQLDVFRIVARNRGQAQFIAQGMRDWEEETRKISCTLSYKLITPEGEHNLLIPMQAAVENGRREWQIVPSESGYVKSVKLSRLGWWVKHAEDSGQMVSAEFLHLLAAGPEQRKLAYLGYISPDADMAQVLAWFSPLVAEARLALAGGAAFSIPTPQGLEAVSQSSTFLTGPNGNALNDAEQKRLQIAFQEGRISPQVPGTPEETVLHPVFQIQDAQLELHVPIRVGLATTGTFANGTLILATTQPAKLAEYKQLVSSPGALSATPPADITKERFPWHVRRIESDLKALAPPRPPAPLQ
ncbi:MAG: TIGR04086 family membrane protein [Bacteroidales bacterium]|nr:TIGR04086 family membrane protein [Bacteroidales bacterium]